MRAADGELGGGCRCRAVLGQGFKSTGQKCAGQGGPHCSGVAPGAAGSKCPAAARDRRTDRGAEGTQRCGLGEDARSEVTLRSGQGTRAPRGAIEGAGSRPVGQKTPQGGGACGPRCGAADKARGKAGGGFGGSRASADLHRPPGSSRSPSFPHASVGTESAARGARCVDALPALRTSPRGGGPGAGRGQKCRGGSRPHRTSQRPPQNDHPVSPRFRPVCTHRRGLKTQTTRSGHGENDFDLLAGFRAPHDPPPRVPRVAP